MKKLSFKKLIMKKLSGSISPVEDNCLNKWISDSSENKKFWQEYKSIWTSMEPTKPAYVPDAQSQLKELQSRLSETSRENATIYPLIDQRPALYSLQTVCGKWIAIAATLLIISTLFFLYDNYWLSASIHTDYGEIKTVVLPDGSSVTMNADSELKYDRDFGSEKRNIHLSGEAFLKVERSNIPFIVSTENSLIQVVGTEFNIKSRENKTTLVVTEGVVAFSSKNSTEKEVILHAHEISSCIGTNSPTKIKSIAKGDFLGWLNGVLEFNEANIYEVVWEIERSYDISIEIKLDSFSETLSGSFKENSPEEVVKAVCLAFNIKYHKENSTYVITN